VFQSRLQELIRLNKTAFPTKTIPLSKSEEAGVDFFGNSTFNQIELDLMGVQVVKIN
jgi:hypothetical protein